MTCFVSDMLMMPILGSLGCEWLLPCYVSSLLMVLFIAIQDVSGCHLPFCISYLLIMPLLDLQYASGFCFLLHFKPANDAFPWLFSM